MPKKLPYDHQLDLLLLAGIKLDYKASTDFICNIRRAMEDEGPETFAVLKQKLDAMDYTALVAQGYYQGAYAYHDSSELLEADVSRSVCNLVKHAALQKKDLKLAVEANVDYSNLCDKSEYMDVNLFYGDIIEAADPLFDSEIILNCLYYQCYGNDAKLGYTDFPRRSKAYKAAMKKFYDLDAEQMPATLQKIKENFFSPLGQGLKKLGLTLNVQ